MSDQENQDQSNKQFYKMADSFIDLANQHCDSTDNAEVGSALLYASSRFSAFVVASFAQNKDHYEGEIDNAIEYFGNEFKRMLGENLEQYKTVFDKAPRYEHLVKKDSK